MSIEIKVPHLGDGVDSGDILEILVREGDVIRKDQGIVELETDKATVEVPSTQAGRVSKVLVDVGQSVAVGESLIVLEPSGAGKTEEKPEAAPEAKAASQKQSAAEKPPAKTEKQPAAKSPPPAAAPEPPAEPGKPAPAKSADSREPTAPEPAEPSPAPQAAAGEVAAGPAIRRFAREVGVDLHRVKGSGPGGRISREDVLEAVRQASKAATAASAPVVAGPGSPSSDAWGPVRIERMSKIRRTIAAHMHRSWETCPRVTNFDDADVTDLERIRVASKADYAARGVRLSSLPFVIKSVAMALKNNPVLNASIDMDNGTVIYKDYVNIGIAVDTERGLVVPSLRNADKMSFPEVARALANIAESTRNNDFVVEDLRGSTFSISNLGAIGGNYATPIINVPEVAILLVGRTQKMPRVMENDQIAVRLVMPLSLAYDHRLVDGAAAARFLNEVIGYLEAPSRLLLAP